MATASNKNLNAKVNEPRADYTKDRVLLISIRKLRITEKHWTSPIGRNLDACG